MTLARTTSAPGADDPLAAFHDIRTAGQLRAWEATLDPNDPRQAAAARFARSWAVHRAPGTTAFQPERHISRDLAAARLGATPCIFMGTNDWAAKAHGPEASLTAAAERFAGHAIRTASHYPDARVALAIVPEKDYLTDRLFYGHPSYGTIERATARIVERCRAAGIGCVHRAVIDGMERFQSPADFLYPDSHLPARSTTQLFAFTLSELGLEWSKVVDRVRFETRAEHCDLAERLGAASAVREVPAPLVLDAAPRLVAGAEGFGSPLGETTQEWVNDAPIFDANVLILGDSHASVLAARKLTYLFAATCARVRFDWNPCAVRAVPPRWNADKVVLETAQRFAL